MPQSSATNLKLKHYRRHSLQHNQKRILSSQAPKDMLGGHRQEIFAERDRKLEASREQRKNRRQRAAWRMKRITSVGRPLWTKCRG
jgi:hypothetical protein